MLILRKKYVLQFIQFVYKFFFFSFDFRLIPIFWNHGACIAQFYFAYFIFIKYNIKFLFSPLCFLHLCSEFISKHE
jgi:hypothetical protein